MTNYFLKSNRIGFRHWSTADLDLARDLWGDIEVTRFLGGPFNEEKIRERLSQEISFQTQYQIQYWPIFELTTADHLGCCGLRPYQETENIFEIGFHFRPIFWGKGFAREAALATIDFAFKNFEIESLFAGHNPQNDTSRYVLGKLGFSYTTDEFYPPTGLNHPSYLLTRNCFNSLSV